MFHIFLCFALWYSFGNCKCPFVNISCHLQWEKLPDFNAFPVNLYWREDSNFFPACWILIGQFKFPASQPYARIKLKLGRYFENMANHNRLEKRQMHDWRYHYKLFPSVVLNWRKVLRNKIAFYVTRQKIRYKKVLPRHWTGSRSRKKN